MRFKLPKEILVYKCDELDGEAIYAVAMNVSEIPEDHDGAEVGVYVLNTTNVFGVKRSLITSHVLKKNTRR